MTHRLALLAVLLLASACHHSLSAQSRTHWVVPTTFGFGSLGCAAGYVAAAEGIKQADERGLQAPAKVAGLLAGCFLGFKVGYDLGSEADSLLAQGEPLETGKRRGVQLGTVLSGATLGSLVAFAAAPSRGEGRRGKIVGVGALAGAALGLVVQIANNDGLYPGSPPEVGLAVGPDGRVVLGVVFRLPVLNPPRAGPEWDSPGPRGAPGKWR